MESKKESAIKLARKAYYESELYGLFIGKISKVYSAYASLPTDPEFLFDGWVGFTEQTDSDKQAVGYFY